MKSVRTTLSRSKVIAEKVLTHLVCSRVLSRATIRASGWFFCLFVCRGLKSGASACIFRSTHLNFALNYVNQLLNMETANFLAFTLWSLATLSPASLSEAHISSSDLEKNAQLVAATMYFNEERTTVRNIFPQV